MSRYAIATREELWSRGRLIERRLEHGEAIETDGEIVASDVRDDALVAWCDREMARLQGVVRASGAPLVRLLAEASTDGNESLILVTDGGMSIVTDVQHFESDVALVEDRQFSLSSEDRQDCLSSTPAVVWRNGSGAVLLHEAYGHPLEHGHPHIAWPSWLTIDAPLQMRRASFRDIPLLRMTHLVASQQGAPFTLPSRRIEVHLVDGGAYEPLTEMVSLRIASADLIDGASVQRLEPFEIHQTRTAIARSIAGATGEPQRYPGVICSREGQELFVGSYAPLLITEFR